MLHYSLISPPSPQSIVMPPKNKATKTRPASATLSEVADTASSALQNALDILGLLSNVTQNVPYLGTITACVQKLLEIHKVHLPIITITMGDNKKRAAGLLTNIGEITSVVARGLHELAEQDQTTAANSLRDDLQRYKTVLTETCAILEDWMSKGFFKQLLKHGDFAGIADGILERLNTFQDAFSVSDSGAGLSLGLTLATVKTRRLTALSRGQDTLNQNMQVLVDKNTRENLEKWLQPANMTRSQGEAEEILHENTGIWVFERAEYRDWIYAPRSLLWLHGISGCGKTILSSSIIKALRQRAEPLAYFYFDTNTSGQHTVSQLLCSLIDQLSVKTSSPDRTLAKLWSSYRSGRNLPDSRALISEALIPILKGFTEPVYIVIDALDECSEHDKLLKSIAKIADAQPSNVHLLVTSRPEVARIECAVPVSLDGSADPDIELYITDTLAEPDFSGGMFRLVSLQLKQLRTCRGQKSRITKALAEMPTSLKTIYDRMLQNLDPETHSTVFRAMNWFIFSKRPMELDEMIDALAFDFEEEPLRFSEDEQIQPPRALLAACTGFVMESRDERGHITVRLAHASVKEYFLSEPRPVWGDLRVLEQIAHHLLAHTCIAYLCSPSEVLETDADLYRYPLVTYAAENWAFHVNSCDSMRLDDGGATDKQHIHTHGLFSVSYWLNWALFAFLVSILHLFIQKSDVPKTACRTDKGLQLIEAILELLRPGSLSHTTLSRVWDLEWSKVRYEAFRRKAPIFSPLYVSAYLGIGHVVCQLLEQGADVNEGGKHGTALWAACYRGHTQIVRILLERDADVNAEGGLGYYNGALQAASGGGHIDVVRILLDHSADVSKQGGFYGNALQAASENGNAQIVATLIDHGADVNAKGGYFVSALQAACDQRHTEIAHLLLESGADIQVPGNRNGNVLQVACCRGLIEIARLLVERGAEINAPGGDSGTALQAACSGGHLDLVRFLLERGAEVNTQGGFDGSALQAASFGGHTEIVHLLLERGANVNARRGMNGTALWGASLKGSTELVRLLLEQGAEVDMRCGFENDSALQAASVCGNTESGRLLVERGADVNAQGGFYGNALQAACAGGRTEMVHMLLDLGAHVNAEGGYYSRALQIACNNVNENIELVRLLLERGAEVNALGGYYGSALQAACIYGHIQVARLLLAHGADIDVQAGFFGNALQAASHEGHIEVVRWLLEQGADVNALGGEYRTALDAALHGGHREIVRLLLEYRADPKNEIGIRKNSGGSTSLEGA
ncbi:ankyrin repeat-containing domain protein [Mycena leptocephala]|nr:ankyrin repeat-containing domain protein [Mycena leptocephala]